jgi:hypothetical protein
VPSEAQAQAGGWWRVRGVVYEPAPNTINMQAYDADARLVVGSTRSAQDPRRDAQTIEAALLLREAIVLRGVDITPAVLYERIVGHAYERAEA